MRVLHVSHSDRAGGAAIAAHRLATTQRAAGIDARMLVLDKLGTDEWVEAAGGPAMRARARAARFAAKRIAAAMASGDRGAMRSLALVPTGIGADLHNHSPDLIHWHWVGAETAALGELPAVGLPAVWTCHDEWIFCGAEHYASGRDYTDGYAHRGLLDIDRLTFARKRRAWARWRPALVCPSEWMAGQANASPLTEGWAIAVVPNTLDFTRFAPLDRAAARARLGLEPRGKIVLFGSIDGAADPRKGFDLLAEALARIEYRRADIRLVTFGARGGMGEMAGLPLEQLGPIADEGKLAVVYSAADVFVAPSRQDNLPNTLIEAQACGTPCVGFAVGGLRDIVAAPVHGALVSPFDTRALAGAIAAQLDTGGTERTAMIRADALARFGNDRVVEAHRAIYLQLMSAGPRA